MKRPATRSTRHRSARDAHCDARRKQTSSATKTRSPRALADALLSELLADFKPVLGIHPLYILSTMALGIWRMTIIADGVTSVMVLWRRRSYAAVSVAHKVFAIAYYLLNMRATLRLGRPLYYQKDYWVSRHAGKKHMHAS